MDKLQQILNESRVKGEALLNKFRVEAEAFMQLVKREQLQRDERAQMYSEEILVLELEDAELQSAERALMDAEESNPGLHGEEAYMLLVPDERDTPKSRLSLVTYPTGEFSATATPSVYALFSEKQFGIGASFCHMATGALLVHALLSENQFGIGASFGHMATDALSVHALLSENQVGIGASFGHTATGAFSVHALLPENQFGSEIVPRLGSDACWGFALPLGRSGEIAKLLEAKNAFSDFELLMLQPSIEIGTRSGFKLEMMQPVTLVKLLKANDAPLGFKLPTSHLAKEESSLRHTQLRLGQSMHPPRGHDPGKNTAGTARWRCSSQGCGTRCTPRGTTRWRSCTTSFRGEFSLCSWIPCRLSQIVYVRRLPEGEYVLDSHGSLFALTAALPLRVVSAGELGKPVWWSRGLVVPIIVPG